MFVFKNIDKSSTIIEENVVNYTHNFTTSSAGIKSINIVSGSISSSYWNSLNVLYYTSGSPLYSNEQHIVLKNISIKQPEGTQHLTKFHGYPSSSIITIPQQYYGEKIEEGSFTLIDKSFTDNNGINPMIKDDKFGNLYSTNAHHSQSSNHASHSDNYVGNIFYEQGLAVITETGSWSGSVKYSDITRDTNFTVKLNSYDRITTHEYSVTMLPHEFNKSMNYSLRMPLSGSYSNINELTSSILSNPYYASNFTGSDFTPYITTIHLYNEGDYDTPVITATLPRPIRKSNKISTTFKIRLDI
jgi:hypothetical protein